MLLLPVLTLVVQQSAVDLSTPEKTLASLIAAFNRGDRRSLSACVVEGKDSPILDQLFSSPGSKAPELRVGPQKLKTLSSGHVELSYTLNATFEGKPAKPSVERVTFSLANGEWRIVPLSIERQGREEGVIATLAMACAHPEILEQARSRARTAVVTSNMRQILTAGLMHLNEYDDKYLLTSANFVKALTPYLKSKFVLTSPLDPPGTVSFSINPNLTKDSFPKLPHLEKTVWFFEGKPGDLKFRYDGKAMVGFCDGHVKFVTPEQAKALLWK